MRIFEEYSDADGDGNLLFSTENRIPQVKLIATYSLSNSTQALSVLFDSGKDRSFLNTADNRIHLLEHVKKSGDRVSEKITYTKVQQLTSEEHYSLSIDRIPQHDSVSLESTVYSLIVSDQTSGSDDNTKKLTKAHYAVQYQNRSLKSLDMSIIPDSNLDATQTISEAALKCFFDYGKGSTGIFQGTINYTDKTISGIYSENGTQFEFTYDGTSETSEFEITSGQ